MLNLSLTAVSKGEVALRGVIAPDDPVWGEDAPKFRDPVEVDLTANMVGDEGVLVRGSLRAGLDLECRRCLTAVPVEIDDEIDLLYEPLEEEEAEDLAGEVYPLPARGDELDLRPAIREQLLLRVPAYAVCSEACRGLCPQCGTNLNEAACECVPETGGSPWDALRKIEFD